MVHDTKAPVRDAVRTFNKCVLNRAMLHLAGRKHWYAAVIRHSGRRSAKSYATPVVADRVTDGFIVPLPYGTSVDWLCNMQAAGRASVTVNGKTYIIGDVDTLIVTDLRDTTVVAGENRTTVEPDPRRAFGTGRSGAPSGARR